MDDPVRQRIAGISQRNECQNVNPYRQAVASESHPLKSLTLMDLPYDTVQLMADIAKEIQAMNSNDELPHYLFIAPGVIDRMEKGWITPRHGNAHQRRKAVRRKVRHIAWWKAWRAQQPIDPPEGLGDYLNASCLSIPTGAYKP